MQHDKLGISAETDVMIAMPEGDKWRALQGKWIFIDGYIHKIGIPGFEFRSGESFGVTGIFHTIEGVIHEQGQFFGKIKELAVENGRLVRARRVAEKAKLIGLPAIDRT